MNNNNSFKRLFFLILSIFSGCLFDGHDAFASPENDSYVIRYVNDTKYVIVPDHALPDGNSLSIDPFSEKTFILDTSTDIYSFFNNWEIASASRKASHDGPWIYPLVTRYNDLGISCEAHVDFRPTSNSPHDENTHSITIRYFHDNKFLRRFFGTMESSPLTYSLFEYFDLFPTN